MDNLKNFRRTNYCGELRLSDAGKTVSLCGWVQRQRDLGGLIFVDLRDRTGLVQLSFDDSTAKDIFEKASTLRSEYVVAATGLVRERESKTNKIATGDIEVYVSELRLLAKAETLRADYDVTVLPQAKKLGKQFGTLEAAGYNAVAFADNEDVKLLGQKAE